MNDYNDTCNRASKIGQTYNVEKQLIYEVWPRRTKNDIWNFATTEYPHQPKADNCFSSSHNVSMVHAYEEC